MGQSRTEKRRLGRKLTKSRDYNSTGTVVHLLVSPTWGRCSNPGHQSEGHRVPLRWCASQGSSWLIFASSFSGSWASNHAPPTMGIAAVLSSTTTAIPFSVGDKWWLVWKPTTPAVDSGGRPLIRRLTRSFKWRLSWASANLRPNSKTPMRAKRNPSHW